MLLKFKLSLTQKIFVQSVMIVEILEFILCLRSKIKTRLKDQVFSLR